MTQRDTLTFGEGVVLQLINEVLPVALTKRDIRESDGDLQTRCRQKAREIDAALSALTRERDELKKALQEIESGRCSKEFAQNVARAALERNTNGNQ